MELNLGRDVTTNITGATQFGTTDNSSKLFAMLSNMLYINKERSCLTELSSNALDAHKLVGKEDLPIHVTMPTSLSNEVRVRDFGPGLSHENVIRFLTTYGESSKQSSNDFIGGFGIGSKSPAAVSDTWTVHSYHEGMHRQYLIFVSATGVPSLTKIMEKPTTESGLEVVIPIKQGATNAWTNAAIDTYLHYPVKPVLHNFPHQHRLNVSKSFIGTNFDQYKSTNTYNECAAIINHRQYPLDSKKVLEGVTLPAHVSSVLHLKNILLKFNIGELSLSLSRENLQYDHMTLTAIQKKLELVYGELKALWEVEVNAKAESELHYFTLGTDFFNKYIITSGHSGAIVALYNAFGVGCKHFSNAFKIGQRTIEMKWKTEANVRFLNSGSDRIISGKNPRAKFGSYYRPASYATVKEWQLTLNILGVNDVVFVLDDAPLINVRVKQAYPTKNVVLANNLDAIPEFLKKNIVLASTLAKPVIVRNKVVKVKSPLFCVSGRKFEAVAESYFTNRIANDNARVAYVRFTSITTTSSVDDERMLRNLTDLGVTVLALKADGDVPTWAKTPKEVFNEMRDDLMKTYPRIAKTDFMAKVKNDPILRQFVPASLKRTQNASKWNEFFDLVTGKDNIKEMDSYQARHDMMQIERLDMILDGKNTQRTSKYDGAVAELFKTYPLLTVLDKYATLTSAGTYANIIQYLESCGV